MKEVKIKTTDSLFIPYAKYYYDNRTICLAEKANEDLIESIINHEYLHAIIENLVNRETAKKYDRLFQDKKGIVVRDTDEYGLPISDK
jgi:hypothetical protein